MTCEFGLYVKCNTYYRTYLGTKFKLSLEFIKASSQPPFTFTAHFVGKLLLWGKRSKVFTLLYKKLRNKCLKFADKIYLKFMVIQFYVKWSISHTLLYHDNMVQFRWSFKKWIFLWNAKFYMDNNLNWPKLTNCAKL